MAGLQRRRPAGPTNIVLPQFVVGIAQTTNVEYSMRDIVSEVTETDDLCIQWLASYGLIANERLCHRCVGVSCTVIKCSDCVDGIRWRSHQWKSVSSIRLGSFFEKSHLKLATIVEMIYHWALNHKATEVVNDLSLSWHTVVDWFNFIRDICSE